MAVDREEESTATLPPDGEQTATKKKLSLWRALTAPKTKFSQRVVHAVMWVSALRMVLRVLDISRTIILARILAPGDFGLMGIALLTTSLLEVFSQTGFRSALIQKKMDIRPYLDTAWTVSIIRGLVLASLLALAAPLAADFFEAPQATLILRVMAVAFFIRGLKNIGIVYFEKDLEFQRRFTLETTQRVVEIGVAITLAFVLQSVWALVYGVLAGSIVGTVSSFLLHPYRPRLRFEKDKANELYQFGKWVLGADVISYFRGHLTDIVVGRVLDVTSLGLYRMAYTLSELTSKEIIGVATQVGFPAYSKLQDSRGKLRKAYLETLQITSLISFPISFGVFVIATDIVQVVLGERWLPLVPAFRVLAVSGLIMSLTAARGPLFRAIGRPDLPTKLQLGTLILMAILVYPMILFFEIEGAAIAVVVSNAVLYPVGVWLLMRSLECSIRQYLKMVSIPFICSALMAGAVYGATELASVQPSVLKLVWVIGLATIIYFATFLLFDKLFGYGLVRTVRRRLGIA